MISIVLQVDSLVTSCYSKESVTFALSLFYAEVTDFTTSCYSKTTIILNNYYVSYK